MKKRALISVTNKAGVVEFAQKLSTLGYEILSTGGTAKALREAGLEITDVSQVTQFPEIMDGRVKTLHPMVHGGLLADISQESHCQSAAEHGIIPIQVLAVNLYEFEKTVNAPHSWAEAVESIDIGGPAMIRAASKNAQHVSVIVEPEDYDKVIEAIEQKADLTHLNQVLMAKAFRHTALYDSLISRYLTSRLESENSDLAESVTFGFRTGSPLRYGENPHQEAKVLFDPMQNGGVIRGKYLWGKELSYNNFLDADGAWELVCDMPTGSCAIIKHGNPCGAAKGRNFAESYTLARSSDPVSAFGGIAAFNGVVDFDAATAMTEKNNFLEVVLGTSFTPEAIEVFKNRAGWGQTVRLLECELSPASSFPTLRAVRGGALFQMSDEEPNSLAWNIVSDRKPTPEEEEALKLMWTIVRHVKSNAIVIGNKHQLLGTGAGQMNRVQSVKLAIEQAGEKIGGCVLASDAFFPFSDSVETAAAAGIRAIVQPGGSKKDQDSVDAANRLGVALVLTGVRHFRH